VLILGGQDKMCDYTGLGEAILSVSRKIVYCGANSEQIDEVLQREACYAGVAYDSLRSGAARIIPMPSARRVPWPSPASWSFLSPAGTSYDQFRHFEERGDLFRQLVKRPRRLRGVSIHDSRFLSGRAD
jgi:UDP-N-acetylmuramoylalanine--D-glutamate ligase